MRTGEPISKTRLKNDTTPIRGSMRGNPHPARLRWPVELLQTRSSWASQREPPSPFRRHCQNHQAYIRARRRDFHLWKTWRHSRARPPHHARFRIRGHRSPVARLGRLAFRQRLRCVVVNSNTQVIVLARGHEKRLCANQDRNIRPQRPQTRDNKIGS